MRRRPTRWRWPTQPELGRISVYAQGGDYHKTVKKALKALARFIVERAPSRAEGVRRHRAGDGKAARPGGGDRLAGQAHQPRQPRAWQLAVPRRDPDQPRAGAGRARRSRPALRNAARRCLDACPTQAFVGPHRIDARRCISYLTIEHDGPIPEEFRAAMGNRIYGCDDCLAVCPWNRFADAAAANRAFLPRAELAAPRARRPARARRCGVPRDVRRIADQADRAQPDDPQLPDRRRQQRRSLHWSSRSEPHLDDPDPVIAEAARWALDQLGRVRARRCRPPDRMSAPRGRRVSTCVTRERPAAARRIEIGVEHAARAAELELEAGAFADLQRGIAEAGRPAPARSARQAPLCSGWLRSWTGGGGATARWRGAVAQAARSRVEARAR